MISRAEAMDIALRNKKHSLNAFIITRVELYDNTWDVTLKRGNYEVTVWIDAITGDVIGGAGG